MNLNMMDVKTICEYIKGAQPDYKGPVFIDLGGLERLHMVKSHYVVHAAIELARHTSKQPVKGQKRGGF